MKRILLSTALLAAAVFVVGGFLSSQYEARVYDLKARLTSRPAPPGVVLVKIDQGSLDFYSREFGIGWPWPRSLYARAVDYLAFAGARAVILDMVFSEASAYPDEDEWLARSLRASGRVFLPLFFLKGEGDDSGVERHALDSPPPVHRLQRHAGKVQQQLAPLRDAARGAGNAQDDPERDGVYRRLRLFIGHRGRVFPSLALAAALYADPGLDLKRIPYDADGGLNLRFYRHGSFRTYAISELIQSQVRRQAGEEPALPPGELQGKVVVIGATATALLDNRATPVSPVSSGFELHATAVANLLHGDFIRVIDPRLQWLLVLLLLASMNLLLPRLRTLPRQLLAALAAVLAALAADVLLFRGGIDLDFIPLLAGLAAVTGTDAFQRYQRVRREKKFIEKAFKGYMSDSLLAEIMKNPRGLHLGGEKKRVTVFFSDLAGFTTLSEKLPAEEVVRVLNTYLERMTSIIIAEGGFVNKFEGDAIMAFWGAPLEDGRQAARAMRAALGCQEDLLALNDDFARQGLPRLGMRIGINSGEVIVGNIGSRQRFEYTVIGDAVNLASRLEGINKQYGTRVICGALAGEMAAGEIALRRLDRVRVKGKRVPEEIFEVVAEKGRAAPPSAMLDKFAEGLRLYFAGDFAPAIEIFSSWADDPPSQVFAKRCSILKDDPPKDWDGVWTFTEK